MLTQWVKSAFVSSGEPAAILYRFKQRNQIGFINIRASNELDAVWCSFARLFATDNSKNRLRNADSNDIEILSTMLNSRPASVLTNPSELEKYNVDWTSLYRGNATVVLKPENTYEISKVLKYCNDNKIGVVPQGGNTGLVGGSVPTANEPTNDTAATEIIVSTEKLNQIHHFDDHNGILICDAGCILQDLQSYLENYQPHPHMFPLDIGAKGSCMIGGNVSTNAGGQYYYRYGSLHSTILGLEVVTPDGSIIDLLSTNRKDNTGYDLKHLFIGAEGTLGIVTKVSISCPRLPGAKNAAFLGLNSMSDVLDVLSLAKQELGEILSACELMDKGILDLIKSYKQIPIQTNEAENFKFSLLVETQGSNTEHDTEKIESFVEKCMESEYVKDGILCQDGKQIEDLWLIRESCNVTIKDVGCNYKYDISVPVREYYKIADQTKNLLLTSRYPDAITYVWGHLIDGNVHLNIVTPGKFDIDREFAEWLEEKIYERVTKQNGSISAEHGLGQSKRKYLSNAKNQMALNLMYSVKEMLDPNGIMNPGKYLPEPSI